MRSSFSSSGNDLGVWCSERHGCYSRITVHLHHPQFTSGTVTFHLNSSVFLVLSYCRNILGIAIRLVDGSVNSFLTREHAKR